MTHSPSKSARDEAVEIVRKYLLHPVSYETDKKLGETIFMALEAAENRGVIRGLRMAAQAIDNGDGIPDDYYQKRAVYDAYPNSATHPGNAFDFTSKFLADKADRLEKELTESGEGSE